MSKGFEGGGGTQRPSTLRLCMVWLERCRHLHEEWGHAMCAHLLCRYDAMSAYELFRKAGVSRTAYEEFLRPTLLVGLVGAVFRSCRSAIPRPVHSFYTKPCAAIHVHLACMHLPGLGCWLGCCLWSIQSG